MPPQYATGEEIRAGDRVLFHGEPGSIEFVVDGVVGDPAMDWYMRELGSGVMIQEPKYFGSAYVVDTENKEHLVFVGRK